MANTYEQIQALLQDAQGNPKNMMGLSNTITRDNGIPLDYSSVQPDLATARAYAQSATAYVGQPIAVGDTLYIVTGLAGEASLKEVGSRPVGDDKSIVVANDGKIAIKGFTAADDGFLPQVQVTLDPETKAEVSRELTWVPISSLVRYDGNTKTVISQPEGSAITVTDNYDQASDTHTYTLDVTFPVPPEYSVTKTENEDGSTTYRLTKDTVAVGEEIIVPAAYNDSVLAGKVSSLETTVGGHTTAIKEIKDQVDAFFDTTADPDAVIDTLKEIQSYIQSDESGTTTMLADIGANKSAIETLNGDVNTAGSVAKQIADAIDAHETEADAIYAKQSALAAVQTTANNAAAKTYVDTELAKKVDTTATELPNFYNKTEVGQKIEEAIGAITGGGGETVPELRLALNNHIDVADGKFAEIATAQGVQDGRLDDVEAAVEDLEAAIDTIHDATNGIKAQAVAAAATETARQVKELADGAVTSNTAGVQALNTQVNGINENINTITGDVSTLKQKATAQEGWNTATTNAHNQLSETVNGHTSSITTINETLTSQSAEVKRISDKFANYTDTTGMNNAIADAISENNTTVNASIKTVSDNLAAEIKRSTERDDAIAKTVADNNDAVTGQINIITGKVAGLETTVAALLNNEDTEAYDSIMELATWVSEHETEVLPLINANTEAINTLKGTGTGSVQQIVADAISKIPAVPFATSEAAGIVKPNAADFTVGENGALSLNATAFSTDRLQQGSRTLILNGGDAEVNQA